jgi:hypothetical protein
VAGLGFGLVGHLVPWVVISEYPIRYTHKGEKSIEFCNRNVTMCKSMGGNDLREFYHFCWGRI